MLPHEIQKDAIDYVRQWRDDERAAFAALERTTIIWPCGPHDFVLVDAHETGGRLWAAPEKGWKWITGQVVEPEEPPWGWHTFYCRPVNGGYEMMPHRL